MVMTIRDIIYKITQDQTSYLLKDDDDFVTILNVNSLCYVEIIVELENEFHVVFPDNILLASKPTIKDLSLIIHEREDSFEKKSSGLS